MRPVDEQPDRDREYRPHEQADRAQQPDIDVGYVERGLELWGYRTHRGGVGAVEGERIEMSYIGG